MLFFIRQPLWIFINSFKYLLVVCLDIRYLYFLWYKPLHLWLFKMLHLLIPRIDEPLVLTLINICNKRRIFGITFIVYAQSRKIGKSNILEDFWSKKTNGPKQDSQYRLDILYICIVWEITLSFLSCYVINYCVLCYQILCT